MITQKHIIRKQTFELILPDQNNAWQFQQRIAEVYRGEVLPKLDEVFSQLADPDTFLKIERLEIDLGRISLAHLEEELTEKVQKCMYEELSKRVHQTQPKPQSQAETFRTVGKTPDASISRNFQTDDRIISQKEYTLELLQHFLRTGTLPWWVEKQLSFDSLEKSLFELCKSEPRAIGLFMKETLIDENSRHRLIHQFSERLLLEVVKLLAPEKTGQFQNWIKDFRAVYAQTQILSLPESEFRIVVWDAVLAVLLTYSPQESTEREIWQCTFKSLAQRQHVTYSTIIQSLQNAVEQLSQSHFVFQSLLPELIEGTSKEKVPKNEIQPSTRFPEQSHEEQGSLKKQKKHSQAKLSLHQAENQERVDSEKQSSSLVITKDSDKQHGVHPDKALHPPKPPSKWESVSNPPLRDTPFNSSLKGGPGDVDAQKQEFTSDPPLRGAKGGVDDQKQKFAKSSNLSPPLKEDNSVDSNRNKIGSKSVSEPFPSQERSGDSPLEGGRGVLSRARPASAWEGSGDSPLEGGRGVLSHARPASAWEESGSSSPAQEKIQPIQFEEVAVEEICIENAGLVLLWPYLGHFFKHFELLRNSKFIDETANMRAIHLLQYLVTGEQETPEYFLALNKLLCGWEISKPVSKTCPISDLEKQESEKLLSTVITHWSALKNTSIKGFRTAFLQREGILLKKENGWLVQVERKAYDLLLERLPWSISMIKLSWMKTLLYVEWHFN